MKEIIESQNGQKLFAEIEGDNVILSSIKGNHGVVTKKVWEEKKKQMISAGYKYSISTATSF